MNNNKNNTKEFGFLKVMSDGELGNTSPLLVEKKKDFSIETLRGIAILLVVFLHSITPEASSGYRHFVVTFDYFYIPLFTTISGYVYAFSPVRQSRYRQFLSGKLRRLILPLFAVCTLQYLLQSLFRGTDPVTVLSEMWKIYVYGYAQFWFLECLALVFLAIVLLEHLKSMSTPTAFFLTMFLSSVCYVFVPLSGAILIDGFFYILPFFVLGCGLNRFKHILLKPTVVFAASLVAILGLYLQQAALWGKLNIKVLSSDHPPLAVITGIAVCLVMVRYRRDIPGLRQIGQHAYPIYLFHGFGIFIGERLATMLPATSFYTVTFSIKVILALLASLTAEAILSKQKWMRRIFLGNW